jgi:hypothetical protein
MVRRFVRWTPDRSLATIHAGAMSIAVRESRLDLILRQIDGHWTLTMSEVLPNDLDEIWAAVSQPDLLSRWLPFAVISLEPQVNGQIVMRNPDGSSGKGVITDWQLGSTIAWRTFADGIGPGDHDSIFRFDIDRHMHGTEVTSLQHVANRIMAPMVAVGWSACLRALQLSLREQPYAPMAPDVQEYERYVRELGLDAATLEPIPGGTRIRFERQTLMQPVEKFWSVMTAGLTLRAGDFAPPTFTGSGESGRISILAPPSELEYLTSNGGRVKWRFHEHFASARISLQIAVPRSVDAQAASEIWRADLSAVVVRVIASD